MLDLADHIGSGRWWAQAATLFTLIGTTVAVGLMSLPLAQPAAPEPVALTVVEQAPPITPVAAPPPPAPAGPELKALRLERGDTLMDVLLSAGASRRAAYNAIEAMRPHINPARLGIGTRLDAYLDPSPTPDLIGLTLRTDVASEIAVERGPDGFSAERRDLPMTDLTMWAGGPIDDSLYLAAERAGVPAGVIVELIRLYSFSVDFQRDIRPGDRFEVTYRRQVAARDGQVRNGRIVAALLVLRGKERPLYHFVDPDSGDEDYFDAAGHSVRRSLMRTPIDGARLTSRYGRRRHPVLGYTRMHRGLDFGAPTGTPIYAAGDGVVERASRWGSYGNYVRIRHPGSLKTAYAHLSRYGRGIKAGARVKQGQIIGYVGATGRVTGAHLHYEVLVDGKQTNPLTLDLPSGRELEGAALQAFLDQKGALDQDSGALKVATTILHETTAP